MGLAHVHVDCHAYSLGVDEEILLRSCCVRLAEGEMEVGVDAGLGEQHAKDLEATLFVVGMASCRTA